MRVVYVGVDEAGRGAVIGPMVIAFVAAPEELIEELKKIGVKDSKKLSPKKREEIFSKLLDIVHRSVKVIPPKEIDNRSLVAVSIDEFELIKISNGLYEFLDEIIKEHYSDETVLFKVFVDAPGSYSKDNRKEFASRVIQDKLAQLMKRYHNVIFEVVVEPKADDKYPIVSAASIIAKVSRDKMVEELKRKIGEDFGSGYPSDPKTVSFLERLEGEERPDYIRSSRATAQKIKKGKKSFLERFLEEDRNMMLLAYFYAYRGAER